MAIFAKANILPPQTDKADISSTQESVEKDYQALAPVQLEFKKREHEVSELLRQLKECETGKKAAPDGERFCDKYEKISQAIISKAFTNDFKKVQIQRHIQKPKIDGFDQNITDICLSNLPKDNNTYWGTILKETYKCKEIIFECKNISGKVDAKHVYQLFGYLTTGTGFFGIILCRKKNVHGSAERAIQKVQKIDPPCCILIFDDKDLEAMLEEYKNNRSVENFFLEKTKYLMWEFIFNSLYRQVSLLTS